MNDILRIKAEFILGGGVRLPEGFDVGVRISRSTAGPGAGNAGVVFRFGGCRVKKSVSYTEGEFELRRNDDGLALYRDGTLFVDGVTIQPVAFHCPEQAFFNLDQRCMFRCVYCNSPFLGKDTFKGHDEEGIIRSISSMPDKIRSVALTSGVVDSVNATVDRMASCVRAIHDAFPEKTIGVEPYVTERRQIDRLREAGAGEIKINCEAATKEIFERVCPDLDYDKIFEMLAHAVEIFGRGKVASNLIFGFGETDEEVISRMEMLAHMGVAPGLRALKIGPSNRVRIEDATGQLEPNDADRLIRLAEEQKRIMSENGLDTRTFETMCFECACCDLVPFRDF